MRWGLSTIHPFCQLRKFPGRSLFGRLHIQGPGLVKVLFQLVKGSSFFLAISFSWRYFLTCHGLNTKATDRFGSSMRFLALSTEIGNCLQRSEFGGSFNGGFPILLLIGRWKIFSRQVSSSSAGTNEAEATLATARDTSPIATSHFNKMGEQPW